MTKRGISPNAIRQFWVDCGIKDANIEFSWENLYAYNRDIVQNEADRYFFVWNPTSLKLTGMDKIESHAPLHPDHPEKGVRKHVLVGDPIEIRVVTEDLANAQERGKLRLKDLGNVELTDPSSGKYIGNDLAILKEKVKIIHWVPLDSPQATVYMPDGTIKEGFAERIPEFEVNKVVQFERFGFVRIDSVSPKIKAYYTHP